MPLNATTALKISWENPAYKNVVNALQATFSIRYSWNLVRIFALMKSLKMGHVGSKTRSIGHILEKLCVRSKDLIFTEVLIKLGQNVCIDNF